MHFESAKTARIYADIETQRTGKPHVVVATIKYLCPPKTYFGRDHCPSFAVVLRANEK